MKLPICGVCAETGSLCPGCTQKVADGFLTTEDVEVSKFLKSSENTFPLEEATVLKVMPLGGVAVLFTEDAAPLIGRAGRVAKAMSDAIGKKVKILEKRAPLQQNISELLLPAKLKGINQIYKDGHKAYRVRIDEADRRRLPTSVKHLSRIMREMFGERTEIVFE